MLYRTLNNAMELEKFNKFIQSIPENCNEKLTIYLDGVGGDLSILFKYLDFIENYPSEISIVVTEKVVSSDFLLFILSRSKKRTSPMAIGYWHKAFASEINLSLNKEISKERNRTIDVVNKVNLYLESKVLSLFSSEEITQYNANEDVYLDSLRMNEIAHKAEELFFKN